MSSLNKNLEKTAKDYLKSIDFLIENVSKEYSVDKEECEKFVKDLLDIKEDNQTVKKPRAKPVKQQPTKSKKKASTKNQNDDLIMSSKNIPKKKGKTTTSEFGNTITLEKFVLDENQHVIGKETSDGNIEDLTDEDILVCKKKKYVFDHDGEITSLVNKMTQL